MYTPDTTAADFQQPRNKKKQFNDHTKYLRTTTYFTEDVFSTGSTAHLGEGNHEEMRELEGEGYMEGEGESLSVTRVTTWSTAHLGEGNHEDTGELEGEGETEDMGECGGDNFWVGDREETYVTTGRTAHLGEGNHRDTGELEGEGGTEDVNLVGQRGGIGGRRARGRGRGRGRRRQRGIGGGRGRGRRQTHNVFLASVDSERG